MAEASWPPRAAPGTVVVTLPGQIDMNNAISVGAELSSAFGPGVRVVIADMSDTGFCDTSAVHALVTACRRASAAGAELRLVAPPGPVLRVLELLRLAAVLAVYPTLDTALAAKRPGRGIASGAPPRGG
jgi:anti-sigma B factor antagonist